MREEQQLLVLGLDSLWAIEFYCVGIETRSHHLQFW